MQENKIKSVKLNAVINAVRTFLSLLFPLITFPYASRILLPEGLGKVNFAQSIIVYFSLISSLGIYNYGVKEAAKLRDNKLLFSQFYKEVLSINLIATLVAYLLFFISLLIIPKFSEYRMLLCISSATILFSTLGMEWLYSAVEDFMYITIRTLIFQIISLFLLFMIVHTKDDCIQYALISVIANVGSNTLNFIHSRKYVQFYTGIKLQLKKHLKPIFVLFAMAVTVKVYTALDTTMLGFIKGDWAVGIYTASTKINKIVLSLVVSVGAVLFPRLSYYVNNEDKTSFTKLLHKGLDFYLLLSIPCSVALCILGKPIILLFSGENYLEAILVSRIMNPIIIIISLSNFIGIQLFLSINKEKWTFYSVLIGALANFFLNLFLISKYGAIGAAIATVIAESLVTCVQIFFARPYLDIRFLFKLFLIYLLNALIMGISIFVVLLTIQEIFLQLILGALIGSIVYIFLLYIQKNIMLFDFIFTVQNKLHK